MSEKRFHFKQFYVDQNNCAMKVGTDGVLLGAWTSLENNPNSILDIGAGTGLIALQMAQRSQAELIDAIEVDENAYEQCVENFEASPWSDRLFCYHTSFQEFVAEMDEPYELIVSNPPFYVEEVSSGNISRDKARQQTSLPFETLLSGASKLLSPNGQFAVVLPFTSENEFITMANGFKLYPKRLTRIKGSLETPIKRSLAQFSKNSVSIEKSELIIETERHKYTQEYIHLTKGFYLKM